MITGFIDKYFRFTPDDEFETIVTNMITLLEHGYDSEVTDTGIIVFNGKESYTIQAIENIARPYYEIKSVTPNTNFKNPTYLQLTEGNELMCHVFMTRGNRNLYKFLLSKQQLTEDPPAPTDIEIAAYMLAEKAKIIKANAKTMTFVDVLPPEPSKTSPDGSGADVD